MERYGYRNVTLANGVKKRYTNKVCKCCNSDRVQESKARRLGKGYRSDLKKIKIDKKWLVRGTITNSRRLSSMEA